MDGPATPSDVREPDDVLRLQILGPLRVWRGHRELDVGPRQQACLLAALLARTGHPVPTSQLIDLIWDDDAPQSALNVIHKYVGALRRVFEPALPARSPGSHLVRRGNGYLFISGPAVVDLEEFHTRVADAGRAAADEQRDVALRQYEQALALWRGAAGIGLDLGLSATDIFTAINTEFLDVCVTAADVAVSLGAGQRILAPLRIAAAMAPLNEPVHAALISVLGSCGQQAEALQLYRDMRNRLADELGVDPGQALQRAHQRVLAQQPEVPALLSAPRPAATPPDVLSSRQTGFVGRVLEAATATAAVEAAADGRTALVLIEGEPGIGKTRFCEEVSTAAGDRAVVAWGNCPPSEGTPAMWPWMQVIEFLLDHLPEQRKRAWRRGPVGRLVNATEAETPPHALGSDARFNLFERMTALIAEVSTERPTVLIIDDLHWADPCSVELFAHIAARLPKGVALIGSFRDRAPAPRGDLTRMLAAASRVPGVRRIRLAPLTPPEVAELITIETRREPDADMVDDIYRRTAGNPFFVQELTRLLVHHPDGDAVAAVPATVRDVVLDRIAGMVSDDDGKALLITAALIGRTIDVNVLAHAAGLDIHRCLDRLEPLDRLGILTASDDAFEVRFVHDLVREAVIDLASSHQATAVHYRIACALETCCSPVDSVDERLAHHLWSAGPRAAPERTAYALIRAGQRMVAKCAFESAEQTLGTAVTVSRRAGRTELEAEALAHLIALVGMQSMYGSSGLMELLERAEHLAMSLGREREAVGLLYSRWAAHAQAIELDVSRPLAQRLLELGSASADPVVRSYGFQAWGIQQWNAGNIREAFRYLQRSKHSLLDDLCRNPGDPVQHELQWLMAGMLAETTALHGDAEAARAFLDVMAAAAGRTPYLITVCATFSCRIAVLTGDPQAAMNAARQGIAMDPGFDFTFLGTYQRLALYWSEAMTGDSPARAAENAEELITTNLLDPPRSCVSTGYIMLGEMWTRAGRYDAAATALDRAEHCMDAFGQRYPEGLLLLMRARLLQARGAPSEQVYAAAENARATSAARGAHLFAQRAHNLLGETELETCRPAV